MRRRGKSPKTRLSPAAPPPGEEGRQLLFPVQPVAEPLQRTPESRQGLRGQSVGGAAQLSRPVKGRPQQPVQQIVSVTSRSFPPVTVTAAPSR